MIPISTIMRVPPLAVGMIAPGKSYYSRGYRGAIRREASPMLYVDIPTANEFRALAETRADACVSIYLPTSPLPQESATSRVELKNLSDAALGELERAGFDKRRLAGIGDQLAELGADDAFWRYQAHSLAVLATPDTLRTFRLPNRLPALAEVSDRFHVKPLIRAITFPHEAFVLALSENAVRLVEVFSELPAQQVMVNDLPRSAADAVRRATVNERSPRGRLQGSEGQKVLLRQYARQIDAALRPILAGRDTPLILAATEPMASIFRSVTSQPGLAQEASSTNPDRVSPADLAAAARPILDRIYASDLEAMQALFERRREQGRATTDVTDAARAATFGVVEYLLVDIDQFIPGLVDEANGRVTFGEGQPEKTYGIVDEIAKRALINGARVLGVREDDIPGRGPLAATLRYPL